MPMPKVPKWVTRFHRTRTDYTPAIDKAGLKAKSPNMGENTYVSNAKDLENVWLADNRYNIPVLRRYGASPEVTTYKVRIPHDKYWYEMKRNTMPKGRGGGTFKPVKPGQPSMFSEGDYKVDLIGEDIPPQYLQKLPIWKKDPAIVADDIWTKLTDAYENGILNTDLAFEAATKYLPRRLRGEARAFSDKMASYQMDESNPPHQPSEELVRALMPTAVNDAIVDFAKKHRANLAQIKSPAHALSMTLDDATSEIPVVYNVPVSWEIYDQTKSIYPAQDIPIHQGAISRGELSSLNNDPYDWEPMYTLREQTRPGLHKLLNEFDAGEDPGVRKLDSLYLLPGIHALNFGGVLNPSFDRIMARVPENRELFYKLLDANDTKIKHEWDAKGIKYKPEDVANWRNAKYWNWWEGGMPTYEKNLLQTLPEPNRPELDYISEQLLK